jgi:NAD(P)H-flavin reductase
MEVDLTVDAADDTWQGKVGVVPKLIGTAEFDPPVTHAFVCGPEIMMRFAAEALIERGIPTERIHLSMERDMKCGVGHCGHCQLGPTLICRDGPVYTYAEIESLMAVRQL